LTTDQHLSNVQTAKSKHSCACDCSRGATTAVGVRGITPEKFMKTHMLNNAFWWVGSPGRVYSSKQQALSRAK